jgi:hypothetical protein
VVERGSAELVRVEQQGWESKDPPPPVTKPDGRIDYGVSGAVDTGPAHRVRTRLEELRIPNALSPEFLNRIAEGNLRTTGLQNDHNGVGRRFGDLGAWPGYFDQVLRVQGLVRDKKKFGGVSINSTSALWAELQDVIPLGDVDAYGWRGQDSFLVGQTPWRSKAFQAARPRVEAAWRQARYDPEVNARIVSNRERVGNLSPWQLARREWGWPQDDGRMVTIPTAFATNENQGWLAEWAADLADAHGLHLAKPSETAEFGRLEVRWDPTKDGSPDARTKIDVVHHWAETRGLDTVVFLDDAEPDIATAPSNAIPGVELLKVMPISSATERSPMLAGPHLPDAYLNGPPEVVEFIQKVGDIAATRG